MDVLLNAALFVAGLVALFAGASLLVRGASRLALSLGISPLVVGLTVVAFGTSAPEMAVSVGSAWSGTTDLALGNAVGSNIFNVLFILGVAALITPLAVDRQVIRQEAPIMVGGAALLVVMAWDSLISRAEGMLLAGLLVAYTVFLVLQSRRDRSAAAEYGSDLRRDAGRWDSARWVQLALVIGGLVLLVGGSQALVTSAVAFARVLGVSDVVIGLTIVAAGTSLPEVAASVVAALKGERDIAVGNVVGSCVFNLLGVVGLAALAASVAGSGGLPVPQGIRDFDLWVMFGALIACLPVFLTGREIARWEGALFLSYYVAYTIYLVMAAQRYGGLEAFGDVMIGFVIPLTLVTLAVALFRARPR
jgi:cation:H+ antiporter